MYDAYLFPSLRIDKYLNESKGGFEALFSLFRFCLDQVGTPFEEFDNDYLAKALCDREKKASTAIGGKAFPHAHLYIKKGLLLVIRLKESITWPTGSIDDRPTSIIIIIISPKQLMGLHLKIMRHIDGALRTLIEKQAREIDSESFQEIIYNSLNELEEISLNIQ